MTSPSSFKEIEPLFSFPGLKLSKPGWWHTPIIPAAGSGTRITSLKSEEATEDANPACLKTETIAGVQNNIQCFKHCLYKCSVSKFPSVLTSSF